jgi:hypothetical protein
MSTTLVVAEPNDRLARRVAALLPDALCCTPHELFAGCGFALRQDATSIDGELTLAGRDIPFASLSGVLFRPARQWRPPGRLGARQRVFVQHEMQAAWCAVLNALPCPVLNRMEPASWLDATLYRAGLAQSLARDLGLAAGTGVDRRRDRGAIPARPATLFLIGSKVVADDPRLRSVEAHLATRAAALARWRDATGIGFARIEFDPLGTGAVERVEPVPAMGRAPAALLGAVCHGLAGALA